MNPDSLIDWIALNQLPGLGPIVARRALARYPGQPEKLAYELSAEQWVELGASRHTQSCLHDRHALTEVRRKLRAHAEHEFRICQQHRVHLIPWGHPNYPSRLTPLPDAPVLLYAQFHPDRQEPLQFNKTCGQVEWPFLALVGSRRSSPYGRRVAERLASDLASVGIVVVSGGALGIDAAAHRGAVQAQGITIAVLGSGLMRPYPAQNRSLFDRIRENGALISEFPVECQPKAQHFPRRNRLISGISHGVIVVEAAERSGTRITVDLALEQGRPIFAVPGPITQPTSAGCHTLIREGATLLKSVDTLLQDLSGTDTQFRDLQRGALQAERGSLNSETGVDLSGLDPEELAVFAAVDAVDPIHIDTLAATAPVSVAKLQRALMRLELRGAVEVLPGGYYVRNPELPLRPVTS